MGGGQNILSPPIFLNGGVRYPPPPPVPTPLDIYDVLIERNSIYFNLMIIYFEIYILYIMYIIYDYLQTIYLYLYNDIQYTSIV